MLLLLLLFPNSNSLLWRDPGNMVQLQHQVPGKVPDGTEGSSADTEVRFRKVLVQSLGEVPEDSVADTEIRSRKFFQPRRAVKKMNSKAVGDSAWVYF